MKNIYLLVLGIFVAGMAAYAIPHDLKKTDNLEHRSVFMAFDNHNANGYIVSNTISNSVGISHYCMWRDTYLSPSFEFIKTSEITFVPRFKIINGKSPRYLGRCHLTYNYSRQKNIMLTDLVS